MTLGRVLQESWQRHTASPLVQPGCPCVTLREVYWARYWRARRQCRVLICCQPVLPVSKRWRYQLEPGADGMSRPWLAVLPHSGLAAERRDWQIEEFSGLISSTCICAFSIIACRHQTTRGRWLGQASEPKREPRARGTSNLQPAPRHREVHSAQYSLPLCTLYH
jgi:hypothetical protein